MSIYAANRAGFSSVATVGVNENYKSNDIGRILYESQVNDMAIFEAVVVSDMRECYGLREGTLLESEIAALNEGAVKEFFKGVKSRLELFWSKIKGAFKAVIQKISAYILRDGKAFVAEFEKKYTGGETITKVALFDTEKVKIPSHHEIEVEINKDKTGEVDKATVVAKALGRSINSDPLNPKEFREKIKEFVVPVNAAIVNLKKYCSNASDAVKELTKNQKDIDKKLGELMKKLKDEEKAIGKDNKEYNAGAAIKKISALVSAYESVVSLTTAATISGVKTNLKNSRAALSRILAESKNKNDKVAHEAAAIAASDEVEEALDDSIEVAVDADTQAEIDNVAATADAEVAAEMVNED